MGQYHKLASLIDAIAPFAIAAKVETAIKGRLLAKQIPFAKETPILFGFPFD
jgi:hypothetical protein